MSKRIILNSAMRKILASKFQRIRVLPREKHIANEIDMFFKKMNMYEKYEQKCFSAKNIFESDVCTQTGKFSVVDWEWETNEIYLDKSLIKRNYRKSIILSSDIIEKTLKERFQGNLFVISFCVQFGKFRNISIRICQDSDFPVLDENLEKYSQPIMQIYLRT